MTRVMLTAAELERLMVKTWGPDFRDKAIVGPLGSFRLRDAFEECGLVDPQAPAPSSGAYALRVPPPIPLPLAPLSPADQLRAAAAYIRRRYPDWLRWRAYQTAAWEEFASGSTRWPLSPAPRSPHGDPLLNT